MKLRAIPTNIFSGFLGVGKTSTILSLLKAKPAGERWAILVNEFGEIGIDGDLLEGQHRKATGIFVREVPGGCMCCAAGLPMQIALNQLLAQSRPSRLLIEPTGLGHPREVLESLSASHYQDVLDIQKNITLVDARKLSDTRYTNHDTFNQQIDIADLIVGNKADLYEDNDASSLVDYIKQRRGEAVEVVFTQQGVIMPSLLDGQSQVAANLRKKRHAHHHHDKQSELASDTVLPESGYLSAKNQGEGFESMGWRFSAEHVFDRHRLLVWFQSLNVERLKGIVITNDGVFSYNLVDDELMEIELDDCVESRIEIIADSVASAWESELLNCCIQAQD
ncbi:CobW family GTP-binding protein [Agaribacter flavus]|uniref:CobW family GTP-binding protein n=1 Tax=Agaribacter flavus TaxID=1902781 RepID=A0ABV7FLN1_9ALTE